MGAGKTSIFTKLLHDEKKRLENAQDAKKEILLKEAWQTSPLHYAILASLSFNTRLAHALLYDKITASAWTATEKRRLELQHFVDSALSQQRYSEIPCSDRLIRTKWFIRDLTDVALLLEQAPPEAVLVHDESLLQRGVGFGIGQDDPEQYSTTYFNTVPLPDLVVHVDLPDAELLRKRINQRPGDGRRFVDHLETAIEISRLGATIMGDRGVNVVECDGRADIKQNASKVAEAAADLSH
ncbi:hypothetical protein CKO15_11040 [Halorhodospira abdelmalekii]|nr:hypothetical protein [Halorhodospira abdelmalekii]